MGTEDSLKKILNGAVIAFFGMFLGRGLSYLYTIIIARIGTEIYGSISIALSITTFLILFSSLGLDNGIIRYVSFYLGKKDNQRVKGAITSALKISLPLSLLFGIGLAASSGIIATKIFHNEQLSIILKIFALTIPFTVLMKIYLSTFRAFKRVGHETIVSEIIEKGGRLLFTILALVVGWGTLGVSWAYVFSTALASGVAIYFLEKSVFPIIKTKIVSINFKKELVFFSVPIVLAVFLNVIIARMGLLMIGYFRNVAESGIYNAAISTADLILIAPTALFTLFMPIITELYSKKKLHEVKNIYKTVSKWAFFINWPIFLTVLFFSKQILRIIFGPQYLGAYASLLILAAGNMVYSIGFPSAAMVSMVKKTKLIFFISLLTAITNILLNYTLIPIYGIVGGAIATAISLSISGIAIIIANYNLVSVQPYKRINLKAIVTGFISVLIVYYLFQPFRPLSILLFIVAFGLFLLIYLVGLIVLRSFEKADIDIIRTMEIKSGLNFHPINKYLKKFI